MIDEPNNGVADRNVSRCPHVLFNPNMSGTLQRMPSSLLQVLYESPDDDRKHWDELLRFFGTYKPHHGQ